MELQLIERATEKMKLPNDKLCCYFKDSETCDEEKINRLFKRFKRFGGQTQDGRELSTLCRLMTQRITHSICPYPSIRGAAGRHYPLWRLGYPRLTGTLYPGAGPDPSPIIIIIGSRLFRSL